MKKILITVVAMLLCVTSFAQKQSKDDESGGSLDTATINTAVRTAVSAVVFEVDGMTGADGVALVHDSLVPLRVIVNTKVSTTTLTNNYVPKTLTVAGHALSGNVTVSKSDVGLGNADNTSDANKPVSTATQTALNGKENSLGNPSSNGYVLSSTTSGTRSWVEQTGGTGGGYSQSQIEGFAANVAKDSITAEKNKAVIGLAAKDSVPSATYDYVNHRQLDSAVVAGASAGANDRIDSLNAVVTQQSEMLAEQAATIDTIMAILGSSVDLTPPHLQSIEVGLNGDTTVIIHTDADDLNGGSIPATTDFAFKEGASSKTISSVEIDHDSLIVTLADPAIAGTTYTMSYTKGTNEIEDTTGNDMSNFTNHAVTNNVEEVVLVESITVQGAGGATTIATNGGTLQMHKKTLPTNANDTTATWSVTNGTGTATIGTGGLLTATGNGTVTARATANDGSDVYGEEEITISNQVAGAPSFLRSDTYTIGWYVSDSTSYITKNNGTPDLVSQWNPIFPTSGGHNLTMSAGSSYYPTWSSSGIIFDDQHALRNQDWAQSQPIYVYVVASYTYVANARMFNHQGSGAMRVGTSNNTGNLLMYANSTESSTVSLAAGTVGIIRYAFDGSNSFLRVNGGSAVTINAGTQAQAIFYMPDINYGCGMVVQEVIIRAGHTDTTNEQNAIVDYLNAKYSVY